MTYVLPVEYVPSRYRCCSCLHVRTGTLMLAVFQIVVHFIIIAILTAALGRASRFRDDVEYTALSISVMSFIQWERFSDSGRFSSVQVGTSSPISEGFDKENPPPATSSGKTYARSVKYFMNAGEEYVAIAVTLISLMFSIMMLVGTIYAKPYYLLPYCCIQFIDLFVTCLSVVGYYTYLPESGAWVRPKVAVSLLVILAGVLLLALKTYLLAMVWLCYKFLLRYAAGLEQTSGFSLVAGSCLLPVNLCHRLGFIQFTNVRFASAPSVVGDRGLLSGQSPCRSPSGSRSVVVLFHRPGSRPPPATGGQLATAEDCLPPKYEDVLAMTSNDFDPPPYESVVETQETRSPDEIHEHSPSPKSTRSVDGLNNSQTLANRADTSATLFSQHFTQLER